MIRSDNNPSNSEPENPSPEVLGAVTRRRPGRPKGLPKPEGSGRKPGTPNKVGKEARDLASKYTAKAFRRLATMLDSKDEKVAAIAVREILDRAYGKPVSPSEISGPGGTPLVPAPEMSDHELAIMTMHLLIRGGVVENEPLSHARKPRVIEPKPVDPFADQRAEQAARIEAATTEAPPEPADNYATAAAAQRAERDLARAESRLERPVPVWIDGNAKPRPGEDYTATSATVTRFRPRHHRPR